MFFYKIFKLLLFPIKKIVHLFIKKRKIIILFRRSNSLGDNIILTGIIKQVAQKVNNKIILFTNFPEIFENNNKIYKVFNLKKKKLLSFFLKLIEGDNIFEMNKEFEGYKDALDYLRNEKSIIKKKYENRHLAEFISGNLHKELKFENFKNEIFFNDYEIKNFEIKFKNLIKTNFVIVNPHTRIEFTPNKGWGFENFQKLVDISDFNWCQVGNKNDRKLNNVNYYLDLNLRELFYLVSEAKFLVSNEGYLNHIASSFEKKIYVIKPGIVPKEYFSYKNTIAIERDPPIECSPCYLKTPCLKKERYCMTDIKPEKAKLFLDTK